MPPQQVRALGWAQGLQGLQRSVRLAPARQGVLAQCCMLHKTLCAHRTACPLCTAGDMPSPGQEPITVSMQLADGSTQQFYGALADFGPLFEPGCSEPSSSSSRRGSRCGATPSNGSSSAGGGMAGSNATSSNATTKDGVGASSRDGTAGAEAAPAHQQQSQAPQPPQPLHWRGRELAVRQGGQPGRDWRVVYVLGEEHPDGSRSGGEEEDDPYEDPEGECVSCHCLENGQGRLVSRAVCCLLAWCWWRGTDAGRRASVGRKLWCACGSWTGLVLLGAHASDQLPALPRTANPQRMKRRHPAAAGAGLAGAQEQQSATAVTSMRMRRRRGLVAPALQPHWACLPCCCALWRGQQWQCSRWTPAASWPTQRR